MGGTLNLQERLLMRIWRCLPGRKTAISLAIYKHLRTLPDLKLPGYLRLLAQIDVLSTAIEIHQDYLFS
jgi:hypothetical protein